MPILPLASVPAGSDIYIDANIVVYAMLRQSPECLTLMSRCERELFAYSDVRAFHDASHQLMLAEAAQTAAKWRSPKNLKANPTLIKSLTRWPRQVRLMRELPIEWIDLRVDDLMNVPDVALSYGLL